LFVDSINGNDSTATRGDAARPWKTASNAVFAAQSGDTVLFRPGDHIVPSVSWNANYWTNAPLRVVNKTNITIAGLSNSRLIMTNAGSLFAVENVTNITFRDLHMVGTVSNSATPYNHAVISAHNDVKQAQFLSLKIHNWHGQGISTFVDANGLWKFKDWLVQGCDFYNIGGTNGFVGQPNDGTPLVFCGENIVVANNSFRDCWRGFESYTWPFGGITNEIFKNYTFIGNIFDNIWEHGLQLIGTNQQNYLIKGNQFISRGGKQSAVSSDIYVIQCKDMEIADNVFIGSRFSIEWPYDSGYSVEDITIRDNLFKDITNTCVQIWDNTLARSAGSPKCKRIRVIGNNVSGTDAGFVINAYDSEISRNYIIDSSKVDGSWGAIAVGFHPSVPTNSIFVTNITIVGNVIGNSAGTAYTDNSIVIGTRAHNTKVGNNLILAGNAISDSGTNTTFYPDAVNTSQFANSSTVTIKSGTLLTNLYIYGNSTNVGTMVNATSYHSNLVYRPISLASPASTLTVDLAGGSMQVVTMTNNTTVAITNAAAGVNVSVLFIGPTNNQFNLIMPSGVRLYSGAITNAVTTNKSAIVSFTAYDSISTNVVATVAIEP
jgi:hypothetical protein